MLHAEVRTGNRFGFFLVFPLHQCNPNKLFLVGDRFGLFLYFAPDEQSARQAEKNNANEKRGTEPASGPVPLRLSSGCFVGRAIVLVSLYGLLMLPLDKFPLNVLTLKEGRDVRPYVPGKRLHSRIRPVGLVDRLSCKGSPCSPCRCLAAAGSLSLCPEVIVK